MQGFVPHPVETSTTTRTFVQRMRNATNGISTKEHRSATGTKETDVHVHNGDELLGDEPVWKHVLY